MLPEELSVLGLVCQPTWWLSLGKYENKWKPYEGQRNYWYSLAVQDMSIARHSTGEQNNEMTTATWNTLMPCYLLSVSYAWHLIKFWQTWHKRRPIVVSFSDTAWRWILRYQLPSRSASINLRIICTMLMYCVHKLVKPFYKLTTWSTQLSQL